MECAWSVESNSVTHTLNLYFSRSFIFFFFHIVIIFTNLHSSPGIASLFFFITGNFKQMKILLLISCSCSVLGFSPTISILKSSLLPKIDSTSSALFVSDPGSSVDLAVEGSRRLFYLWFFGGSGGAGLGISAFPGMYQRFKNVQKLKGQGPTAGGENLGISPLCGLPEDLKIKDVQKILNKKMTVEQIVKKGPQDSFWAQKGYLRVEAFQAANKDCNPLAVRAIFDAMSTGTSNVEPYVAQAYLDEFRKDLETFKKTLLFSKFKGYVAIGTVLGLLGLTASVCAESFADGWFPNWPGRENFPLSLFTSPGILSIKDYWI